MKAPLRRPQPGKRARKEYMQGDAPIDGFYHRQQKEQNVRRIEQCGLKAAEKRRAAEEVGIPKGQVSPPEFLKAELAPMDELQEDIRAAVRQHAVPGQEQNVAKHRQGQRRQ
jgi:hypothetical protein